MDLVQIYQCLCDPTRLRILQVKISKHLAYLRDRGMVMAEREQNWMIYSLPKKRDAELQANLQCLQDCAQNDPTFKRDLRMLAKVRAASDAPSGALLG
jgi:ArsR family transcriptional regulator, arsenate/arsenite/antimonite-responsive transcriptional repressor